MASKLAIYVPESTPTEGQFVHKASSTPYETDEKNDVVVPVTPVSCYTKLQN